MQDVRDILPTGSVVQERYVVEDLLGRGGFGAVYKVQDQRVRGNLFALKEIIDTNKQERERFTFEGEVLKRLDHRSLPRVYRVFEDDTHTRAYMLMDYIDGPNLEVSRQQQPEKRFPLEQALNIMAPIFDVVSYFHKQEPPIIHRDIKPANIIVPTAGDEAVLVDFGIAKEYNMDATTTAIRRCSPGYGAPEQYARGTNPGTDIYGLAATLYALLTGIVPIDAFYRMTQIGSKKRDPLEAVTQMVPAVPASVSDAIQKAMAINSADRWASVEEFWQELNAYRSGDPIPSVMAVPDPLAEPRRDAALAAIEYKLVTVIDRPVRNKRRSAFILLFASLALIALVGGLVLGNSLLFALDGHNSAAATSQVGKKATSVPTRGITAVATVAPTRGTTAVATAVPRPTAVPATPIATSPPPALGGLPALASSYKGSVTDQINGSSINALLTLAPVKQNRESISGYATISDPLQGSGNFSGTVSASGAIQFLIEGYSGHAPLLFTGKIQNGTMSGDYCSAVNGQCDKTIGGYGIWSVASIQNAGSG